MEELYASRTGLDRCQFFEMLVRCGVHKYFATKYDLNAGNAVKRLIEDDVLSHVKVEPFMNFREQKLWTNSINCIFRVNLKSL